MYPLFNALLDVRTNAGDQLPDSGMEISWMDMPRRGRALNLHDSEPGDSEVSLLRMQQQILWLL